MDKPKNIPHRKGRAGSKSEKYPPSKKKKPSMTSPDEVYYNEKLLPPGKMTSMIDSTET